MDVGAVTMRNSQIPRAAAGPASGRKYLMCGDGACSRDLLMGQRIGSSFLVSLPSITVGEVLPVATQDSPGDRRAERGEVGQAQGATKFSISIATATAANRRPRAAVGDVPRRRRPQASRPAGVPPRRTGCFGRMPRAPGSRGRRTGASDARSCPSCDAASAGGPPEILEDLGELLARSLT